MIKRLFFIWFLCFVCCLNAASEEKKAFVQTRSGDVKKVFAGQRIPFYVTLLAPSRFTGTPRFDIPEVSGVIIMEVEDRPVLGSNRDDGMEWLTKTHEFAAFPQTAGDFVISPFPVSFAYVDISTHKAVEVTYQTNEIKFSVQRPAGTKSVDHLISTVKFTVKETWEPTPENPKVGDAFVRTITRKVKDIPGMVLLPVRVEKTDGLGIYQDPPRVQDKMQRGEFTGTRIETITYVCESEGRFEIPVLQFHWFDLKSGSLKEVTLPAVLLDVAPTPQLKLNDEALDGQQPINLFSVSPTRILAGVCLLLLLYLLFKNKSRIMDAWSRHQKEKARSENSFFKKFKTACLSGDDAQAFNSMLQWLERLLPGTTAQPVKSVLQPLDQPKLLQAFTELEQRLYSPGMQKNETTGSNEKLFVCAKKFRKKVLKADRREKPSHKRLHPLNP